MQRISTSSRLSNQPEKIKLVLLGDGNSGKTSMLISYTTDKFNVDYVPTVFDSYVATIKRSQKIINLELWDTAGQDQYKRLRPLSYPKTDLFLICFSLVDPKSFNNAINKWLPEVNQNCPHAVKIFVGTKSDLRTEYDLTMDLKKKPMLPYQIMQRKINATGSRLMTCSALSQDGLSKVFESAMDLVLQRRERFTVKKQKQNECQII